MKITTKCLNCNLIFEHQQSKERKFCSQQCFREWKSKHYKHKRIIVKCKTCNKSFAIFPSRKGIIEYCSRKCSAPVSAEASRKAHLGDRNYNWQGGRSKNGHGYWMRSVSSIPIEDKWLVDGICQGKRKLQFLEHRYLIAKKMGRTLTKEEIVHHINGIKEDNRLENLQLLTKSTHSSGNLGIKIKCPICGYEF